MASQAHPDAAKLPPGFVVVPSVSRPGQVSYLHQATNKKYMTLAQTWEVHLASGSWTDPPTAR